VAHGTPASTRTIPWASNRRRNIGDAEHWEASKRREFQNDALIALTAVRHGATVVTSNGNDFELLARNVKLRIVIVAP
jgi:predicted nucleic acid-binding protein